MDGTDGVQEWFRERSFVNMVNPEQKCKYSATVRRVRATTVAVEKQQGLHIVSVCL